MKKAEQSVPLRAEAASIVNQLKEQRKALKRYIFRISSEDI